MGGIKNGFPWQSVSSWLAVVSAVDGGEAEIGGRMARFLVASLESTGDSVPTHIIHGEYIIEREGEYPTPVYHSVVSLDRGHDLYNIIHTCGISLFVQSNRDMASQRTNSKNTTTWPAVICMNNIIKIMSPIEAYYTVGYWSRILSLPLYYILLILFMESLTVILCGTFLDSIISAGVVKGFYYVSMKIIT